MRRSAAMRQEIRSVDDVLRQGRRVSQPAPRGAGAARQPLAAAGAAAPPGGRADERPADRLAAGRPPAAPPPRADRPDRRGVRRRRPRCARPMAQAAARFRTILAELVAELPVLRQPASLRRRARSRARRRGAWRRPCSPLAGDASSRRWRRSPARSPTRCWPRWSPAATLDRAYVNNGGDIALHLAPGQSMTAGGRRHRPRLCRPHRRSGATTPVRGVATSGWRGRCFSLGIADAVTVLARDAAPRPTRRRRMIANAVDLPGHPADHARAGVRAGARQRPRRPAGDDRRRARCTRARLRAALDAGAGRGREASAARLDRGAPALFLAGRSARASAASSPLPASIALRT